MPRCGVCEVRKEVIAQQASVIEALTRALDAVRPVAASLPVTQSGIVPQTGTQSGTSRINVLPEDGTGELPSEVRQAVVTVAGYQGPLRDHLEEWAMTALSFGMAEAEVARRIFEGDNE